MPIPFCEIKNIYNIYGLIENFNDIWCVVKLGDGCLHSERQ